MVGRIHYGRHEALESAADQIIADAVRNLPASQKTDVLTPWKERERRRREVYTSEGTPRGAFEGNFHRAYDATRPHLSNRDGRTITKRNRTQRYLVGDED